MRIRLVASNTLVLAVAFARLAVAQRAESTIAISAAIAAPVTTMAPDALAPEVRFPSARSLAAGERQRRATERSPIVEALPAAAARYRVRIRLDSSGAALSRDAIVVRDADDRERRLETGAAVTIVRGATAAEARAAVVRLRVSGRPAGSAGDPAVHLVYEVTSESALTM